MIENDLIGPSVPSPSAAAPSAESVSTTPATPAGAHRLVSLDACRGITIAGMILVTDPGTYSAVYPQLLHAQWFGATLTDMIFPSFLFITGVAVTLSFAARLEQGASVGALAFHVVRRTILLFLFGLLINGFPDFHLQTLRIPGILQRIALCYFAGSMLYLAFSRRPKRSLAAITCGLLALYWILIRVVPVPGFGAGHLDSNGNLPAYLDRSIFGVPHLWTYGITPGVGVTFDPEGILSTIAALATLLIGILAGSYLRESDSPAKKARTLAIAGAVLFAAGLALSPAMPLIKKIWTPTFALLSAGFALAAFALCYYLVDGRRWRSWTPPALVFGTNSILAFVIAGILTTLSDRIGVGSETLHSWSYHHLFATWLAPVNASLAYAVSVVLLNVLVMYPLYRRRIFLRI